ncbi:MFS transporter [Nocardia tengchongensis]|uniref:MFS transporter n=1 Tax=Nocardia tengchongensis TaxID=2055889 RepID=UPI003657458A
MTSELDTTTTAPSTRPVLLVACAATFLAFLDASTLNMAFSSLVASFPQTTQSSLTWTISAYATAFAAGLAIGGRAADALGHRMLLMAGVLGFTLASVACALAPSAGALIGARAVQGVGAALILPAALGALLTYIPAEKRVAAIGAWGAAAALAAAIGPSVGAVLVDVSGWRAIFWINLPACAVVAIAAAAALPGEAARTRRALPDLLGAAMLAAGTAALVAAITEAHEWGYSSPATLFLAGGGTAAITWTVSRSQIHPRPVFVTALWRHRGFVGANLVNACLGACLFTFLLAAPLWLTTVWKLSLMWAATAVGIAGAAAMVGAALVGWFAQPATARWFAAAGMGSIAMTFAMLASPAWSPTRSWTLWVVLAVTVGIGVGAAISAASVITAAVVGPVHAATGIGGILTSRQIGGALGVAVLAATLAETTSPGFRSSFHHLFAALGVVAAVAAVLAMWLLTTLAPEAAANMHPTEAHA